MMAKLQNQVRRDLGARGLFSCTVDGYSGLPLLAQFGHPLNLRTPDRFLDVCLLRFEVMQRSRDHA